MRNPWIGIAGAVLLLVPALSADDQREPQRLGPGLTGKALPTPTVSATPSPQTVDTPPSFSLALEGALELGGFVFKGGTPFLHNDGTNNTTLGLNALVGITTGFDNTAMGTQAMRSNSTGSSNTAVGSYALYSNTYGNLNTAIGTLALLFNTEGGMNTAVGRSALEKNETGSRNTAMGERALYNNLSTDNNTAIGYLTLFDNTGLSNTAVGWKAGENITDGSSNTAVGPLAGGLWTDGNNNVALGVGSAGVAGESGVIRIGGLNNQMTTFIEGISDAEVAGGAPVCITAGDELGLCPAPDAAVQGAGLSPLLVAEIRRLEAELAAVRRRLEELERGR